MLITSSSNQHFKWARRVRDGKEPAQVFVEGEHLAHECLESGIELFAAFYDNSLEKKLRPLLRALRRRSCPLYDTDEPLLRLLSDTVNSQGLVIVAARPQSKLNQILDKANKVPALIVGLDRIQDPGNAGTIVRTAAAAGASGLVTLNDSVDPFSPKSLRASMGSAFRLPVVDGISLDSVLLLCHEHEIKLVGSARGAALDYTELDWFRPTFLLLGNEAVGIRPDLLARCDVTVGIPLTRGVESLNVAAAAAVLLFEAARQRRLPR